MIELKTWAYFSAIGCLKGPNGTVENMKLYSLTSKSKWHVSDEAVKVNHDLSSSRG